MVAPNNTASGPSPEFTRAAIAVATGAPGGYTLLHIGASLQVTLALVAPLMVIRRKVSDVRARRAGSRNA